MVCGKSFFVWNANDGPTQIGQFSISFFIAHSDFNFLMHAAIDLYDQFSPWDREIDDYA